MTVPRPDSPSSGGGRKLVFAGHEWRVKSGRSPMGPGDNRFSERPEDVWVDADGLHLTISKRDGRWYATEVITERSFGYGTYLFQTRGRVDALDPAAVLGLFTWDDDVKTRPHRREIDVEFSRWGDPDQPLNAQYAVHPRKIGRLRRFRVDLSDEASTLTHVIRWSKNAVVFETYRGRHRAVEELPTRRLIHRWSYAGSAVPQAGTEKVRINFWIRRGDTPQTEQRSEIIVAHFACRQAAGAAEMTTISSG